MEKRYESDAGYDFENWICFELPRLLNLSASKETAVIGTFGNFADTVRQLERVAQDEYYLFFKSLKDNFEEVSRWKAKKGSRAIRGYGVLRK